MSKITNKKIRNLKAKSVIPAIIFFLLSSLVGFVVIIAAASLMFAYMAESKFINAKDVNTYLAGIVAQELKEGATFEEAVLMLEKDSNHPDAVCIIDESKNIIASYGDITVDFDNEEDNEDEDEDDINLQIYSDKGFFLSIDHVDRNFFSTVNSIFDSLLKYDEKDWSKNYSSILLESAYDFAFWSEEDIDCDGYQLLIKNKASLTINDVIIILVTLVSITALFFVLLTIQFITTIVNIVSQRSSVKMLLTDAVTGGNNNLGFMNKAEKKITSLWSRSTEYMLVDFSVLKYQSYCSLYGVEEGERLLMALEKYFWKCNRMQEVYGRIAKADFAFLYKVEKGENGEKLALERIQKIMRELPEQVASINVKTKNGTSKVLGTGSLKMQAGVYFIAAGTDKDSKTRRKKGIANIEQLYIKAGTARMSLQEGEDIAVYNHEMWEKEMWEQKVEDTMLAALEREEYQVYIQPKYHPATEELVGGEALVRWISPTEGFISPGKFIPIFEKTGFVTRLDDYMISHTAALQAKWLAEGKKIVPISVNVSRAHFAQSDLAEHIRDLVDQYQLPHEYLEIELTESAFFDDKNALLSTVKRLQEYGFEVSMDDFGSGYSSLNSLKDLPLNVLKLDAEFFRGDDFDTRGEIVVSEAIALAKQLNMRIVAEGVEKKEQVDFLAGQNCDMIQGFYFDKPMPAGDYETRMKDDGYSEA